MPSPIFDRAKVPIYNLIMNSEIVLVAKLTAKPGLEDAVFRELRGLVEPTRREPGCIRYDLHRSPSDPCSFLFLERWRSQADIDKHFEMPYLKALQSKSEQLLSCPVEISLWAEV